MKMRFSDLLRMSLSNLWRRKMRTFLTVLGVIIGTASIVVMVSIGIGQNRSMMMAIEQSGSLTAIEVNNYQSFGGNNSDTEVLLMNRDMIETFRNMEHVTSVNPRLDYSVIMKQGAYICDYVRMRGVTQEELEKIPLGEGSLPDPNANTPTSLEFVVGNNVITDFYNEKTNEYYWNNGILADVDFMNVPLFTTFDREGYWNSQGGQGDPPKKYMLKASGLVEGGVDDWNQYSYYMYCNIDALESVLKQIYRNKVIPGQPTQKNGKPYSDFCYETCTINVDKMENVNDILVTVQDMGFSAYSNVEWMESMQQSSRTSQMVLGGIGAVSLFVAAIGIANTMMMSIYERTKEIGVIKVLGCSLGNIRMLFLLEAAFIGFLGGVVGVGLSYGISAIINRLTSGMGDSYYGSSVEPTGISYIPLWLTLAALGFAVLVGVISGFLPALRAMKLSPLAAIRNE